MVATTPGAAYTGLTMISTPNGPELLASDFAQGRIDVFDYDPAAGLTGRRPFMQIPDEGRPDGLTVDAEGRVWTAISNGGAVHCYSPKAVL